jgi:ribosome-associated heat shock protein Hsp15
LRDDRQRIDRWLWHARIVRTRALAASLAASGHVRVNGQRVSTPGRAIRIGDVLTVALPGAVKVLKVASFSARRGGASDAARLYSDLSPPPESEVPTLNSPRREAGADRPSKRERRALERLRQRGSGMDE